MIKKLTIYFPYYNQPDALKNQLEILSSYDLSVRKKIKIFIVDDGSQVYPALPIIKTSYFKKLDITLWRIDIDIPWNMPEANNLAFKNIETNYVLRTDIDHFIELKYIKKLFNMDPKNDRYYRFLRLYHNEKIKMHPNSYIITKKNYWKTNGYNESFCGNYGFDDIHFLRSLNKICKSKTIKDIYITTNRDYSTKNLSRDISINQKNLENKVSHLIFQHKDRYQQLIKNSRILDK
jgi:hypothetical protein